MESQNNRQTFKGDWKCSSCNTEIKELPFEPRGTDNLLCRECHAKSRPQGFNRRVYKGDWKCSSCDANITELPFEPRETGNLLCKECFKKSKEIV